MHEALSFYQALLCFSFSPQHPISGQTPQPQLQLPVFLEASALLGVMQPRLFLRAREAAKGKREWGDPSWVPRLSWKEIEVPIPFSLC